MVVFFAFFLSGHFEGVLRCSKTEAVVNILASGLARRKVFAELFLRISVIHRSSPFYFAVYYSSIQDANAKCLPGCHNLVKRLIFTIVF